MYNQKTILGILTDLDKFALENTTDPKIFVGAVVGKFNEDNKFEVMGVGCNCNHNYNERKLGRTYREFLFGSRDTKYRPWDKIIHAEENAIIYAVENGFDGEYDTAIVTRYPCEKCAQLLIYKGIKTIYYGRSTKISETTQQMLKDAGVNIYHIIEYDIDESYPWIKEYDEMKAEQEQGCKDILQ
jgi:deoxycytidylate deaminase